VYVAAIQFPYDDIQFPYDDKVHPAPCELRWLGAVSEWDGKAKGHMWLVPAERRSHASTRSGEAAPLALVQPALFAWGNRDTAEFCETKS
ncbi:MAG TPA: hypothetical protein VKS78_18565, partial [Roseiarcus sp.]|nr:hypothetical protein [Roseiarcus sp.]